MDKITITPHMSGNLSLLALVLSGMHLASFLAILLFQGGILQVYSSHPEILSQFCPNG